MTEEQREAIEAYEAEVASHTDSLPEWEDEQDFPAFDDDSVPPVDFDAITNHFGMDEEIPF